MRTSRLIIVIAMTTLMTLSLAGCTGGCDESVEPYSVSGTVMDPDGVGIGGITLAYTGKVTGTTTTDGNGHWGISGIAGSITITLSRPGWYFTPEAHLVNGPQSDLLSIGIPILTPELREQFDTTSAAVSNLICSLFDPHSPSDSLEQIAQRVRTMQGVEWVYSDLDSLAIEHVNGGIELWLTGPDTDLPPWAWHSSIWDDANGLVANAAIALPMPGNTRAAVVYTVDADPGRDNYDEPVGLIEELLRNAGYEVYPARDDNAGVGFFQRLNDYGVVFLQTHGASGFDGDGNPYYYFQTGEEAPDFRDDLYEEWQKEWICKGDVPWGTGDAARRVENARAFWHISDKFVREYLGQFPGTLLISAACSTLANESMPDALIGKGVQAVAGWTGPINYGAWPAFHLLANMKTGTGLRGALDALPQDMRTRGSSSLELRFRNPDGDILLVAAPAAEGPTVAITKPLDGQVFDSLTVWVGGTIYPSMVDTRAILSVNGLSTVLELDWDPGDPNIPGDLPRSVFGQWVNLSPGDNTIQVTAINTTGSDSMTIHVRAEVPEQDLWTRLVWNTDETDIDFHLYPEISGIFSYDDCHWRWESQPWGAHLDIDDVNGFGPEHITGETISPGSYILAVHYYSTHGVTDPTNAQVLVRTPSAEKFYSQGGFTRSGQIWTVCRITYPGGLVEDIDSFSESMPLDVRTRMEKERKPGER